LQLPFDPLVHAHPADFFRVAGARAECQPRKNVRDLFCGREFTLRRWCDNRNPVLRHEGRTWET
jgi:hypothetical protein